MQKDSAAKTTKNNGVQSVERAFRILENVCKSQNPISVQDLSEITGIGRTTVHGLVNTLYNMGYIDRSSIRGHYVISPKLYGMICAYPHRLPVVRAANRRLIKLSDTFNSTVHLCILSPENEAMLIKAYYPDQVANISESYFFPLHATAVGKALLAYQPEERRENLIQQINTLQYTKNTIHDKDALRAELAAIRQCGYSEDRAEYLDNTYCIAFPIWDDKGQIAAAFSLSDYLENLATRENDIIPIGLQCSKSCSMEMGWKLGTACTD